jgi:predicted ArsR family transcriptional regulator
MKPLENHPYGGLDVNIEKPEEYCCTPKETKQNIRERFDKEYHGLCLGSTQGTSDSNKEDLKNFFLSIIDEQLKEQASGVLVSLQSDTSEDTKQAITLLKSQGYKITKEY